MSFLHVLIGEFARLFDIELFFDVGDLLLQQLDLVYANPKSLEEMIKLLSSNEIEVKVIVASLSPSSLHSL